MPSRRSRRPGRTTSTWEFITIGDPHQSKAPENRERIRRRAIQDYHDRRRSNRDRTQYEMDDALLQAITQPSVSLYLQNNTPGIDRTGSQRLDPFRSYPIPMNYKSKQLLYHLYDRTCPMFNSLLEVGYLNIVTEKTTFYQLLATSSWHIGTSLGDNYGTPHLTYSVAAIESLNERLKFPATRAADQTVEAILAFAWHSIMVHDTAGMDIHLNGLDAIVRQRGGLNTLDHIPVLRTLLFWIDINAALLQDTQPRFHVPYNHLPLQMLVDSSEILPGAVETGLADLLSHCPIDDIYRNLYGVDLLIQTEASKRDLFEDDALFPGCNVAPILHQLLALRRYPLDTRENVIREVFRLGAILFLGQVRVRFGVFPIPEEFYAAKLKDVLSAHPLDWTLPNALLIWALTAGGASASLPKELRLWFVSFLSRIRGVESFDAMRLSASVFPFFEAALAATYQDIRVLLDTSILSE